MGRPVPANVPRANHASGFGSLLLLYFAGTGQPTTVLRSDEVPGCAGLSPRRATVQGQGGAVRLGEVKEEERTKPEAWAARGTFAEADCPTLARLDQHLR